jgi:5'-nucleotidase (lipoprotein e(P4) family)
MTHYNGDILKKKGTKMKTKLLLPAGIIALFFLTGYPVETPTYADFNKSNQLVIPVTEEVLKQQVKMGIGDQSTMAVLWSQISAEKEALYFQGYHIGKLAIDQSLTKEVQRKRAIVLDIDETVLDNSPYFAYLVNSEKAFPYGWDEWVKTASAKPLAGAKEFLHYVNSKNIDIYYVSNRIDHLLNATIKNLKEQGFPQVNKNHVILQSINSNKGPRIKQLTKDHTIVCLFGDNLGDFVDTFNGKTTYQRSIEVKKLKDEFGSKFIVFPNPMYGDWEWALFHYDLNMSANEKMAIRRRALLPYRP